MYVNGVSCINSDGTQAVALTDKLTGGNYSTVIVSNMVTVQLFDYLQIYLNAYIRKQCITVEWEGFVEMATGLDILRQNNARPSTLLKFWSCTLILIFSFATVITRGMGTNQLTKAHCLS